MESDQILKRVLITDEVDSSCIDILKSNGIEVFADTKLTKQQLLEIIKDYDGLVVRSATKVTEDVILAGTRLKIIGRAGTGVDNVDVKTATQRGIAVMNTPDGNTLSAAELTCAMLLTTSRNIAQGTEAVKSENWKLKSSLMGNELFGKTLAVIGLGRIGREVAVRMQAFGMKTIGYDPIINGEVSITFGVEWLPLPEIWSRADYITIHVPLIPQTKYMINAQTLSQCKRGVRIVNCARGGIIDESALLDALNSGHCAAAGLDVFEQEPTTNKELVNHSRVTSTPHLGASTYEAQVRVANDIAKQFVSYSTGSELIGVINAPALTHFLDSSSRCWMELTTGLTQLSASLVTTSNLDNSVVSITLEGRELTELKSGVEGAASVGLLKCVGDGEKSNLISGPYIIKQRNIKIDTEMKQCSGRQSSVSVEIGLHPGVSTGLKVIGTVLQGHSYLLSVDGSDFIQPVRLTGCMLIIRTSKAEELQLLTDKLRNCAVDVLSFIKSANQSNEALHTVWCCIQLSSPLTSELLTTLKVTNNELIKQVQFN